MKNDDENNGLINTDLEIIEEDFSTNDPDEKILRLYNSNGQLNDTDPLFVLKSIMAELHWAIDNMALPQAEEEKPLHLKFDNLNDKFFDLVKLITTRVAEYKYKYVYDVNGEIYEIF